MANVSLNLSHHVRRYVAPCLVCDLGPADRCVVCGEYFGPLREPKVYSGPIERPCVTLEALKTFLRSVTSTAELSASPLLGLRTLSGVTRLGDACRKGHAKRKPGPCAACVRERARKYRARRARG